LSEFTGTDRLRIMWSVSPSERGPDDEFYRRMLLPDNEIPVALPLHVVLVRTADVAIVLLGLDVYTTGLRFDVAVRIREPVEGRDLSESVFMMGPATEGLFRLGVEYADGRRTAIEGRAGSPDDVAIRAGAGSSSERSTDQSWWIHPLPPDGPLTFVVNCGALDIAETSTVIDGAPIAQAAASVVTLWPWSPPDFSDPGPPPPPEIPAGSWFAGGPRVAG
jgi:hypothetical protein